jgi:hypothetical protein
LQEKFKHFSKKRFFKWEKEWFPKIEQKEVPSTIVEFSIASSSTLESIYSIAFLPCLRPSKHVSKEQKFNVQHEGLELLHQDH